jgi:hypothetical protein
MISVKKSVSSEVIVVNGRIAKESSGIVARSGNGVFYTPVLMNGTTKNQFFGMNNTTYFKDDGKTQIELQPYEAIEDKRRINLPTLISNACDSKPLFYNMIASGENALKLSNAPIGSTVHIVGEMRDCWLGKFSIKVLWVINMTLRRKGVYNELP